MVEQMDMSFAGIIAYYVIIALSHITFGIFSTKHRFKKPIVYTAYALFFALFIGLGFLQLKFYVLFLIIFVIYLTLYLVLSSGSIIKNLFIITAYLTFILIFFGITFAYCFISCPGFIFIRWTLLIITFTGLQLLMYLYLIPQFQKAHNNIVKGWGILLTIAILFMTIIFMQIFYPFNLKKDDPWTVILFLLCSFIYFFVFSAVFDSFATKLKYNEEKGHLVELAHRDSLTKLYNKNYFQVYSEELEKANIDSTKETTSIVVMDINKFKEINDKFGHIKGDEVLKQVAQEIKSAFKDDKFKIFRFGGDEFVAVGSNVESNELDERIINLHKQLGEKINISISVGYCFVDYTNFDAISTAIKNADKIMYQHKIR